MPVDATPETYKELTSEGSVFERHLYSMAFDGSARTRLTTMAGNNQADVSPDDRLLAESAARSLLDGWAAMLTGLTTHTTDVDADTGICGHTPSDFPLVDISQSELDEFEATAQQMDEGA